MSARGAVLLTQDRVVGALGIQDLPNGTLGRQVGLGDVRAVGLGVDAQVGGVEAGHRDRIGRVGQAQGQREVVAQGRSGKRGRESLIDGGHASRIDGDAGPIWRGHVTPGNVIPRFGTRLPGRTERTSSSIGRATDS